MKVHSAEGYLEIVKNSEWVEPNLVKPKAVKAPPRDGPTVAKENFVQKSILREQEFLKSLETAKKERARREATKSQRQERIFEQNWKHLTDERDGFVANLAADILEMDMRAQRKKELLHASWTNNVFNPIQTQIVDSVDMQDIRELEARKNEAMTQYLKASAKTDGRVFRDIIMEAEYDPLQYRAGNLTYRGTVSMDPCKPKSMKKINQSKEWAVKSLPAVFPKSQHKETLDATMWDKTESTPYGRYAIDSKPHGRKAAEPKETVKPMCDDYDIAIGSRANEFRKLENGLGKKITGPMNECAEEKLRGKKPLPTPGMGAGEIKTLGKKSVPCKPSSDMQFRGKKTNYEKIPEGNDAVSPSGKRIYAHSPSHRLE